MARIFGFIGNRADLGERITDAHSDLLRVRRSAGQPSGWGIGFYQAGEMLLRRRPIDESSLLDPAAEARNLHTDLLIAHVRQSRASRLRTENTQPFRYRGWLFAHAEAAGELAGLRRSILRGQPEFLRSNVLGETDSEAIFYSVLARLHDAGQLAGPSVGAHELRTALRDTVTMLDRLSADQPVASRGSLLLADANRIIAVHRSGTMGLRVLKGRPSLERIVRHGGTSLQRSPSLESTRFCLVVLGLASLPSGWSSVPVESVVTLTRSEDPVVESL